VLRAVADHPCLNAASKIAGFNASKEQATTKYICKQSAQMMEQACSSKKPHGEISQEKCDATEVALTFGALLPDKVLGVPSMRNHAMILGVQFCTLQQVE
jgi:hypothetical protein